MLLWGASKASFKHFFSYLILYMGETVSFLWKCHYISFNRQKYHSLYFLYCGKRTEAVCFQLSGLTPKPWQRLQTFNSTISCQFCCWWSHLYIKSIDFSSRSFRPYYRIICCSFDTFYPNSFSTIWSVWARISMSVCIGVELCCAQYG